MNRETSQYYNQAYCPTENDSEMNRWQIFMSFYELAWDEMDVSPLPKSWVNDTEFALKDSYNSNLLSSLSLIIMQK